MQTLKINIQDWTIAKEKLRRKYNHLTDADLLYKDGEEQELMLRLARRLNRSLSYIQFTLAKELSNVSSNRL